jgi:hypothetical protein
VVTVDNADANNGHHRTVTNGGPFVGFKAWVVHADTNQTLTVPGDVVFITVECPGAPGVLLCTRPDRHPASLRGGGGLRCVALDGGKFVVPAGALQLVANTTPTTVHAIRVGRVSLVVRLFYSVPAAGNVPEHAGNQIGTDNSIAVTSVEGTPTALRWVTKPTFTGTSSDDGKPCEVIGGVPLLDNDAVMEVLNQNLVPMAPAAGEEWHRAPAAVSTPSWSTTARRTSRVSSSPSPASSPASAQ